MRCMHSERKNVYKRMPKASIVVASVTQQSRQRVPQSLTRVQRPPEGHMGSDGTTSWWPAAERRWRLCAISETGTQSAARYREPREDHSKPFFVEQHEQRYDLL